MVPFTLFYAVPFLFDIRLPGAFERIAGFSLIFLPLTFSWAIVRYRLMDIDLIFKRGVAYTLATGRWSWASTSASIAVISRNGPHQACRKRSASGASASRSWWWLRSSNR